ncbi:MAG TPA: DUF3368 domain-containing protein [Phycisphaerae bacterium]|nr:DUF3368 domain-containing protein [Phycisphaerae bacterium]
MERALAGFRATMAAEYGYLKVRAPQDAARVLELRKQLDVGEAEAVALAMELKADYLLVDELEGRAVARAMGIEVTGVIGVLGRAKRAGLVAGVRPLLDELEGGLKFFIGEKLKEQVLKGLGE